MLTFYRQYPLIAPGWTFLVLSLFLPAFSSDKGVILGIQAAIFGGVYAILFIVTDLFVTGALIIPVDEAGQSHVASSGWEHHVWFSIYLSIFISSLSNILFLASPLVMTKVTHQKTLGYYSRILWVSVICSIISVLYVVLGFQEIRIGYFVWVVSFILIAISFRRFSYKNKLLSNVNH